jgi:hypothetical protein
MSWFFGVLLVVIGAVAMGGGYDHALSVMVNGSDLHLTPLAAIVIGGLIAVF